MGGGGCYPHTHHADVRAQQLGRNTPPAHETVRRDASELVLRGQLQSWQGGCSVAQGALCREDRCHAPPAKPAGLLPPRNLPRCAR